MRFFLLLLCLLVSTASARTHDPELLAQARQLQEKAAAWILARQEANGAWMRDSGYPAITALVCIGLHATPAATTPAIRTRLEAALDYIAAQAKPDGGIYAAPGQGRGGPRPDGTPTQAGGRGGPRPDGNPPPAGAAVQYEYPVYNTSICLLALATWNRPQDLEIIKKARAYLLGPDVTQDGLPLADSALPGGIGYGKNKRPDLNNTAMALEALHATDYLDREPFNNNPDQAAKADLAWSKALEFLTICQNLSETNQSAWIKNAPAEDRGGFIYCPADAIKDEATAAQLRSYGSMTYSGLKSMIYAKVKPDDVRMQSAFAWMQKFYTLDENPGIGPSGHLYYLHTAAKTLQLFGVDTLVDSTGNRRDWRREMIAKLAELQEPDGSWHNRRSGRWMENVPELATSYCLMTLAELLK